MGMKEHSCAVCWGQAGVNSWQLSSAFRPELGHASRGLLHWIAYRLSVLARVCPAVVGCCRLSGVLLLARCSCLRVADPRTSYGVEDGSRDVRGRHSLTSRSGCWTDT